MGYLILVDGVRVLHVGDADPNADRIGAAQGTAPRADVAIVPFWYLTPRQPELLRAIGAARYLAAHIPLADTTAVKRQISVSPTVTALATRGASVPVFPRPAR